MGPRNLEMNSDSNMRSEAGAKYAHVQHGGRGSTCAPRFQAHGTESYMHLQNADMCKLGNLDEQHA